MSAGVMRPTTFAESAEVGKKRLAEETRQKRMAKAGKRDPNAFEGGLELVKRFAASGLGLPMDVVDAVSTLSSAVTGEEQSGEPSTMSSEWLRRKWLDKSLSPAEKGSLRAAAETIADFAGGGGGFSLGRMGLKMASSVPKGVKASGQSGLAALRNNAALDIGSGAVSGGAYAGGEKLVEDSENQAVKTYVPLGLSLLGGVASYGLAGRAAIRNNADPYLVASLQRRGFSQEMIDDYLAKLGGFDAPITGVSRPAPWIADAYDFEKTLQKVGSQISSSPGAKNKLENIARTNEQVLLDKLGKTGPQAPQAPLREVPTQQATQAGEAVVSGTQVPRNSAVSKFSNMLDGVMNKAKKSYQDAYNSIDMGAASKVEFDTGDIAKGVGSITTSMEKQAMPSSELVTKLIGDIRRIRPDTVTTRTVFDPVTQTSKVVSDVVEGGTVANKGTSLMAMSEQGQLPLTDLASELAKRKLTGSQLIQFDKSLNAAYESAEGFDKVVLAKLKEGVSNTIKQDPTLDAAYRGAKEKFGTYRQTFYDAEDLAPLRKALDPRSDVPVEAVIRNLVSGDKGYQFGNWLSDLGKNYGVKTKDVAKDLVDDMFSQSVSKGFAGDAATVSEKLQSVVNASKGLNNALPFAERSGLGTDYIANLQRQNASKAASELNKWSPSDLANMDQRVAATLITNDPVAAISKLSKLEAQPREQAWAVVKQLADRNPDVAKALQSATREGIAVPEQMSTLAQVEGTLRGVKGNPFAENAVGTRTVGELDTAADALRRSEQNLVGASGVEGLDPRTIARGAGAVSGLAGGPSGGIVNYGLSAISDLGNFITGGLRTRGSELAASAKDTAAAFRRVGPNTQNWAGKYVAGMASPIINTGTPELKLGDLPRQAYDERRRAEFEKALETADPTAVPAATADGEPTDEEYFEALRSVQGVSTKAPESAPDEEVSDDEYFATLEALKKQ